MNSARLGARRFDLDQSKLPWIDRFGCGRAIFAAGRLTHIKVSPAGSLKMARHQAERCIGGFGPMTLPHELKRIRLNLARSKEFPAGSARHGYEFVAPL